jgi:acetylornithine deacetylase/succinyl-diaminopimelate desuccinylase-like protein
VVAEELEAKFEEDLRAAVTERILREADFEGQVARAMAEVERPTDTDMVTAIQARLEKTPAEEWREYIRVTSKALTAPYEPKL